MDLGVFDAWAGLLISHPHHQLSAAPSVSQITEFVDVVWLEDENLSEASFRFTSSMLPTFRFNLRSGVRGIRSVQQVGV